MDRNQFHPLLTDNFRSMGALVLRTAKLRLQLDHLTEKFRFDNLAAKNSILPASYDIRCDISLYIFLLYDTCYSSKFVLKC